MAIIIRLTEVAFLVWLLVLLYEKFAPKVKDYLNRTQFHQDSWKRLVTICGGDYERAGRLMQHEKKSHPGINDDEACRRAIEHYERDNR